MSATALTIPLWADLLAVTIGSLQGALFASQFRERRVDLLGVAIIGTATGLGGGILRDLLLGEVPRALQTNGYLAVAVLAALLGMLLQRLFSRLAGFITVLDALTIGLFGAIGSTKALAMGLPEIPAVFVGVVSAVGGSVLRDLLMNLTIAMMHVGSLYAVAACAGTAVLVALVRFGVPTLPAAIAGATTTVLIRLLAVRFGWTLPEQRALSRLPRWRRPR
ncbi:trimeric intracellular cation channel family protein [Frondihabitans cladoniiphilus]|uniref:Trimeric intracellular cation channel family protein n=1 Tax=Frondihabitans cladoniiphilus TaxID=715785 RepID=A0ABP8VNG4_9MICO